MFDLWASCATDLAKRFGAFAACKWLGHGPQVAAKHYLQVPDELFRQAAEDIPPEAARKAAQQAHAQPRPEPLAVGETTKDD